MTSTHTHHIALLILLLILGLTASAQTDRVKVRIFSTSTIETLYVSFDLGTYNLYANDTALIESELGEGLSVEIKRNGTQVHVAINGEDYGSFNNVKLVATDTACILCLNPQGVKQRTYEGNLIASANKGKGLLLLNDVEFETYLAGVVQSEIYGKQSDIFRVQAIISRTWALRNINKHKADGYNFCDHVHCQAYHNRCVRPDIMLGTIASSGETIVDSAGNLIETPFHSNSGGQTANSEDVWRAALPYLRSVADTFSNNMRQSEWTKVINANKWLGYFAKKHQLNTQNDSIKHELLTFQQTERKAKILGVPLTRVRLDFQLKSTFFSVSYDTARNEVTLHGHGYGHGVGLSQEGTIRMVGLGIAYDSIIRHYFTGAHVYRDPNTKNNYVQNYVDKIEQIIEDDKQRATQVKSKKDDWLGRLFRIRDREEREEIYDAHKQDLEHDWEYEW